MKRLAVLAIAAFVVGAAWGDSRSSASVTNLSATLIDLDTGDGLAPSISFNSAAEYDADAAALLYAFATNGPGSSLEQRAQGPQKFGPVAVRATSPLGDVSASVSGDGSLSGTTLRAAGSIVNAPLTRSAYDAGAGV